MYKYVNTNTGQVVESQVRRVDLARLARWDENEVEVAPEPVKPARKPTTKTAKPK